MLRGSRRRVSFGYRTGVAIRRLAAACCFYTGLNTLFRILFRKGQGVVLMYHRVVDTAHLGGPDAAFLHPGMYVGTQAFERQMRYLSRCYRMMNANAFVDALRAGRLPANVCVITFDDGWKDNYTQAFPILAKYRLPATVFLVSDYIGTARWFWPERAAAPLAACLAGRGGTPADIHAVLHRRDLAPILLDRRLGIEQKVVRALEVLRTLPAAERDAVVAELERAAPTRGTGAERPRLILDWSEVAAMRRDGVAFGSHTRSHPVLTAIPSDQAAEEVSASRHIIEERLGTSCGVFAYPEGQYNDAVRGIVGRCYDVAFSTDPGFIVPHDDPFALKRLAIHHDASFTTALFACKISGLLDTLSPVAAYRRALTRSGARRRAGSPGSRAPAAIEPCGLPPRPSPGADPRW